MICSCADRSARLCDRGSGAAWGFCAAIPTAFTTTAGGDQLQPLCCAKGRKFSGAPQRRRGNSPWFCRSAAAARVLRFIWGRFFPRLDCTTGLFGLRKFRALAFLFRQCLRERGPGAPIQNSRGGQYALRLITGSCSSQVEVLYQQFIVRSTEPVSAHTYIVGRADRSSALLWVDAFLIVTVFSYGQFLNEGSSVFFLSSLTHRAMALWWGYLGVVVDVCVFLTGSVCGGPGLWDGGMYLGDAERRDDCASESGAVLSGLD